MSRDVSDRKAVEAERQILLREVDHRAKNALAVVAMVVHELATNAAKHGALSAPGGSVRLAWRLDAAGMLRLCWTERGGPRIAGRPGARGFGSRLLDATIRRQLGGWLHAEWAAEGLRCEIGFPLRPASDAAGAGQRP